MSQAQNNQNGNAIVKISDDFRKKMHDTLDGMTTRVLKEQPEDPIPYIIQYLEDMKGIGEKPLTAQEKMELEQLRAQRKELQEKIAQKKASNVKEEKPNKGGDSESSDSEGEEVAELPAVSA